MQGRWLSLDFRLHLTCIDRDRPSLGSRLAFGREAPEPTRLPVQFAFQDEALSRPLNSIRPHAPASPQPGLQVDIGDGRERPAARAGARRGPRLYGQGSIREWVLWESLYAVARAPCLVATT